MAFRVVTFQTSQLGTIKIVKVARSWDLLIRFKVFRTTLVQRGLIAWMVALLVVVLSPPAKADELSCNSDAAKTIVVDGTFGKTIRILKEIDKALGPTSKMSSDLNTFFGVTANIENVRQVGVDDSGLSCAAEFTYKNMPPAMVTSAIGNFLQENGLRDATCEKLFVYKIERLLDKLGYIHVTWRCFNNGRWD
jgi:hypothetical protein